MNKKQELFAREYTQCFNASLAAIRAGYSEQSAATKGCRLLKNDDVKNYIEQLLNDRKNENKDIINGMIHELSLIAFMDNNRILSTNTPPQDLNFLEKKTIREIVQTETTDQAGNKKRTYKIRFFDKLRAAEILAKIVGAYELDNHQQPDNVVINLVPVGGYDPDNPEPDYDEND